jgi:DNA-binding GntR family transcriptional regulator
MKSDTVYKRAFNDMLDLLKRLGKGQPLPSEPALAVQLRVSRTTVRKVLFALDADGAIVGQGRERTVRRLRVRRFPESETVSASAEMEQHFMEWMLRDNTRPGTLINELELARRFGVATSGVREFLNRFQRFGLIEKRLNSGWVFKGFTPQFALELFEIREMFELRSARAFAALPQTSPLWHQLEALQLEHRSIVSEIDIRFRDFSDLDSRFHKLINAAGPNRFIDSFYDIITLIFHYHYQWNKRDERQRNEVAVREHLAYIEALQARDMARIDRACRAHLASAKETLISSTS